MFGAIPNSAPGKLCLFECFRPSLSGALTPHQAKVSSGLMHAKYVLWSMSRPPPPHTNCWLLFFSSSYLSFLHLDIFLLTLLTSWPPAHFLTSSLSQICFLSGKGQIWLLSTYSLLDLGIRLPFSPFHCHYFLKDPLTLSPLLTSHY